MSYVPEFVALYEIVPYIRNLPLDNESIRVAVSDYCQGGERKYQIIKKYGQIGDWNTSEVTYMKGLFEFCRFFNEDISKWDVSKVTRMYRIFYEADNFNLENAPWYHE